MGHRHFHAEEAFSVPILASLTSHVDPNRIYLLGVGLITIATADFAYLADGFLSACAFRILWGVGFADTYMPGLKALSDRIEGPRRSRAVSAHAGISGAGALLIAETIGAWHGWRS